MLRVVAEFGGVADVDLSAIDRKHAGEDFKQGRFTRAVRPHEHDLVAAFDGEIEVFVNLLRAVGLRDFL